MKNLFLTLILLLCIPALALGQSARATRNLEKLQFDPLNNLKVDGATALPAGSASIGTVGLDAGSNLVGKVQPFQAVVESGLKELIGINDAAMATSTYGDSNEFAFGATASGELLKVCLYATEDGTGAIITEDETVLFFDADPSITAADTSITAVERVTVIADVAFLDDNWQEDANGASNCVVAADAFDGIPTIWFTVFREGATTWNSGADDDEQLEIRFWVRRDS